MKNKKVFDVRKLDTDAYARSLGLVVTPRLRFLQRASKITEQQKHNKTRGGTFEMLDNDKSINNSNVDGPKHTVTSSEDEDDQVLTFKRKILPSDDNIEDERTESETEVKVSSSKRHEKHLSKAFVAKKILNKQIQPNTKLYFSEDGEIIKDPSKERLSDPAEDDEGGINIETAIAVLRKEDEIDKKLYQQRIKAIRQEKRLKEESRKKKKVQDKINEDDDLPSDESSSVDLSFLPDPDKVYGKVSEDSKFDSETNDGNSCSGESDIGKTLPTKVSKKRKFKVEKTQIIKRRRADKSPTEDANIMDTGLSLRDDEELALRLLSSR